MTLITGGISQGKTEYATSIIENGRKLLSANDAFFLLNDFQNDKSKLVLDKEISGIDEYHILVKMALEKEIDPRAFTKKLIEDNPDMLVIINEVGQGIVPIEKFDRTYREAVGVCGTLMARNSNRVIRMICGIPNVIKDN